MKKRKTLYFDSFEKKLLVFSRRIPLTYLGVVSRLFPKDCKTIVDLGCGNGEFMKFIVGNNSFDILGVEVFGNYIKFAKKLGIYKKIIVSDIVKYKFTENYDVFFLSHVIEHLKKEEGNKLLDSVEKRANRRIIVVTPNGEYQQDEYDNNPFQKHKSEWTPQDFKKRGYKVLGQGWKFLYKSKFSRRLGVFYYLLYAFSTLTQPILNLFPDASLQLICYKDKV